MARIGSAFGVALLALSATFFYSRRDILYTFYANRPGSLKDFNILPNAGVEHEDVVRNCEDVYMNDVEGWAVLSCDPGRDRWNTVMGRFIDSVAPPETGLYLSRYSADDYTEPEKLKLVNFDPGPGNFHPLGLEYEPGSKVLFVVNHAESGTRIESFRLNRERLEAKHIGSITDPLLHTANSIAAMSPSTLLVSNDHYFTQRKNGFLATLETYLGLPLASLVRVELDITRARGPPKVTVLARHAFANGVALLDDTTVAVASSSGAAVHVYTSPSGFAKGTEDVSLAETIRLRFLPDNVSVDGNGVLLIAGHPFAPALEARVIAGEACSAPDATEQGCPTSPSWIAEWTAEGGVKDLFVGNGFGSATTAVRDVRRGKGIAVGLYDRGILTWSEAEE
ncbi:hypothetical protein B0A55_10527 [Friedmanniomyces simplex]|uniref:Calcium-dependent phosphotriesterase n=1 Tax=Friedmanniomyces simplex TaxID=329884 RepID=A0A4U0WIM0_9PEZI|nr:hypothetical protein B0A55_10527 [Friedmanniomyces simplex]